jgi:G3E family GTPase
MTAVDTPATAQVLPVSILTGPSGRELVQDIVSHDAKCRFGLLASSSIDSQPTHEQLMVEPLAATSGGGYDPEQIRAQISAIAEKTLVDHLIIECNSKTHPIAFASLFLPDGETEQRFLTIARLSSIVLGIDPETFLSSLVHGNHAPGVASPCILADQIECADVVVLKGDASDRDFMLARAVVSALNPHGRVIQGSRDGISEQLLDAGRSFDFEAAFAGAGWRQLMDEAPGAQRGDEGVMTFVYRARRPFHPEKFWNLIQSPFAGVFRAKGFFWLATRMGMVGGLNIAGSECHHSPAGKWWAASAGGSHSDSVEIPDRFKKEWAEPFGDRRQAIAFMGIDLDPSDLSAQLDACLLSDLEMKSGAHSWAALPDPFPAWSAKMHDHECDDHDCCHH